MAISKMKVGAEMKQGFRTKIKGSVPFVIDQPKAAGGTEEGPNPLEVFLAGLLGCMCALARIIATQRNIDLKGINIDIDASIDKDFLMGKTKEGRAGFTEMNITSTIDAPLSKEEKEALMKEIEERCPIADNIVNKSTIKINVE